MAERSIRIGLVAALIGPFVATSSSDFLGVEYAGAYAMVGVFALTSIPLMLSLRAGHVRPKMEVKPTPVPLSTVRWQTITPGILPILALQSFSGI